MDHHSYEDWLRIDREEAAREEFDDLKKSIDSLNKWLYGVHL